MLEDHFAGDVAARYDDTLGMMGSPEVLCFSHSPGVDEDEHVRVAAVGLLVLAMTVSCSGSGSEEHELNRPWTRAEVSSDGRDLSVWVEPPGDDDCELFDRIDVERDGDTAVVAAVYIRTDEEFCEVPCPLSDERRTVRVEDPLTDVELQPHPDTVASCRP